MATRSVLIAIVALVFVTWILISSINTIQATSQPVSSPTGNQGHTDNNKGGTTQGNGSAKSTPRTVPILGNFTFPATYAALHVNLSFLNFFYNMLTQFYSLIQPLIHEILYLVSFLGYIAYYAEELLLYILNFLHLTTQSFSPGKPVPYSHSGSGSPRGAKNTSTMLLSPVITYAVVAIMVVLVFLSASVVVSRRRKSPGSSEGEGKDRITVSPRTEKVEQGRLVRESFEAEDFRGWSRGNDLINPEIPPDLPLIYPAGKPLSVRMRSTADFRGDYELLHRKGEVDYSISLREGLTETSAVSGIEHEKKTFRGVNIRKEMSLLLRLNVAQAITVDTSYRTFREIIRSEELAKAVRDDRKLSELVRSYERAYYGLKATDVSGFQSFLYGIRDTFVDPKISMSGS